MASRETRRKHGPPAGSYLSQHDQRVHFGLGSETRAQRLEIRWPSGAVDVFENISADRFLVITEGQGILAERAPRKPCKQ